MPRTTPSEKIQTRAARSRLLLQRKPHWLCLRPGQVHLGYVRRNAGQAGHWTVRRYNGGGAYKVTRLPGVADDVEPADGGGVLSFAQAQDLALQSLPQAAPAVVTVAQALADYVDYLQTSGREGAAQTAARTGRLHVLPQLGAVAVQALTTDQLRHWLAALATGLAKRRHGHEDAVRRSRATANRILGTLRAALNHAYADCRVPSDNAWRGRLKPFRNVAVARKRYLTVAEAQRLLNAAEGDFRNLAQAALQTGARYSELTRLKVHDFDAPSGTVGIAKSKAGKIATVRRSFAGFCARARNEQAVFEGKLAVLRAVLAVDRTVDPEMAVIAASSGFPDAPFAAIEARITASIDALPDSILGWVDWLIDLFRADQATYQALMRQDAGTALYVMRGKKSGGPATDAEFVQLKAGLRAWLTGLPMRDIEAALGVDADHIGHCPRARDLALKLASRSLYLIGSSLAEAVRIILSRHNRPVREPAVFETLGYGIRRGLDHPDKIAFAHLRPTIRSRVLLHTAFARDLGEPTALNGRDFQAVRGSISTKTDLS